ncbi:hypothetical protein EC991_009400 [Linnemannia zychae]|nr:hypothetical protein EC991_009400 [Linnemannia zychae]
MSRAFAARYELICDTYLTFLNNKFGSSLFYGVPELSGVEATAAVKTIKDSVDLAKAAWAKAIFQTVFNTIFKDEPKFKGDCNHPHRVVQPALLRSLLFSSRPESTAMIRMSIDFVGPALQNVITAQPKLAPHAAILHGNLNQIMEEVKKDLNNFAGES